jgi:ADP-ribosylglycohydrolase
LTEIGRYRGSLLGLAAGDAVGTTLEFRSPGTFEPISDMVGGGPFGLSPGEWTDDTSMALCLAESLIEQKNFDAEDQMKAFYGDAGISEEWRTKLAQRTLIESFADQLFQLSTEIG